MKTYRVCNFANLLGDFLGAIGALDFISKTKDVTFLLDEQNDARTGNTIDACHFFYPFLELLNNDRIRILNHSDSFVGSLDIDAVRAHNNYGNLDYMTKAYIKRLHPQMGLYDELISQNPKASLHFKPTENKGYDILISPYGRSSTINERIPLLMWRELMVRNKKYSFGILGQEGSDDYSIFADLENCNKIFNKNFNDLGDIFSKSKVVLSIVNGISHFCFHTGTKNILFTNQKQAWGNNPDAVVIDYNIPDISVDIINTALMDNLDNLI